MRVDAHQHFWTLERGDYGWLTPDLSPIYRNFAPSDLEPLLAAAGVEGTILVQAAPTVAETKFMLELADATPFVKGVVGWVDFEATDARHQIAGLAKHPALVGLRPMIQDIEDDDWMLRDTLSSAFEAMQVADLTFDALTLPQHLPNLRRLLERQSEMRVVIDHASKPLIRDGVTAGWDADMAGLADETKAFCKLSGMITEADKNWTVDDLRPFVDHLLTTFGPDRLIWGSDWPVSTLAGSYESWLDATDVLLADLSEKARAAIFGGNALRAYPGIQKGMQDG